MGWVTIDRTEGMSNMWVFRSEFPSVKFIDMTERTVGDIYAAAEVTDEHGNPFVLGMVIAARWRNGQYMYRFMTEEAGPVDSLCPRRILDLLTPLKELEERGLMPGLSLEWARKWRMRCYTNDC